PAITPYKIKTILGGIMGPIVEAQAIIEVVNPLSYPSFNIVGINIPPIAAAAAIAVPVKAAKNMLLIITTSAKPPGIGPTMIFEKLIRRWEIPPLAIISPASIKSGIATNVKLFVPLKRLLGTLANKLISLAIIPSSEIKAIAKAIGTRHIINTKSSTIKNIQSILLTAS